MAGQASQGWLCRLQWISLAQDTSLTPSLILAAPLLNEPVRTPYISRDRSVDTYSRVP